MNLVGERLMLFNRHLTGLKMLASASSPALFMMPNTMGAPIDDRQVVVQNSVFRSIRYNSRDEVVKQ